jgi:hypothetical protein
MIPQVARMVDKLDFIKIKICASKGFIDEKTTHTV